MKIKIGRNKKIFIFGAVVTAGFLCFYSLSAALKDSDNNALASAGITRDVKVMVNNRGEFGVGKKYSLNWDSECKGGEAMVWLSTASGDNLGIGILVPLNGFSAKNFGDSGQDKRIYFDDPWGFNLTRSANKSKTSLTIPAALNLSKNNFGSQDGVFYIYTLSDGRFALHKIVKEQVTMPVMTGDYYFRVDIKGKNGCQATGFSPKIKITANNKF